MLNIAPVPVIVSLPHMAKAVSEGGQRVIYFEASRDNVVDREGEVVAADALWASRELMLEQGDLDISHWSHLANPLTGRPQPEYRIGHPTDVRRSGDKRSIFVKGEVYRPTETPPAGSSAAWAERFWHSLTGQQPAAKWFPSVYGTILPGGIELVNVNGQQVRRIIKVDWYSVGFALRAQHPDLPAVSTSVMGAFAKADQGHAEVFAKATQQEMRQACARSGALHLSWGQFAKSVTEGGVAVVGPPQTDSAQKTGVQALTPESLEGKTRQLTPDQARVVVLRKVRDGTVPTTLSGLTRAFKAVGHGPEHARKLLADLEGRGRA